MLKLSPYLFFLTCCCLVFGQNESCWKLIWSDEFSQVDGSAPNPAFWGYDVGGGGWGNNELQFYTSRAENNRIEGGHLVVEARQENLGGYGYTSSRLLTKNKVDWQYGRFEARIKVPAGQGLWPAFWMLGSTIDSVGWPNCGEIDIMEFVGKEPYETFGTIHGPGYSGGQGFGNTRTFANEVSDDFHTYAVEWEPEEIRWYVDGVKYHEARPENVAPHAWVFDHSFFMILNVAVGGNFGGPVGAETVFPAQMLVDYIRVYEQLPSVERWEEKLQNRGLETSTLNSWVTYDGNGANTEGAYIEDSSFSYFNGGNPGGDPVQPHGGTYVAKVFGDFIGVENNNGFFQEVAAEAGSIWTASGWAMSHAQDLMGGANQSWVEVTFRDASDQVIESYRSQVLAAGSFTASEWINLQVTEKFDYSSGQSQEQVLEMIAPQGTTKVRYQVVFRQPRYGGGSVYFDDLSLLKEREPLSNVLTAEVVNDLLLLSFDSELGNDYHVMASDNLAAGCWSFVETVTGDGQTIELNYATDKAKRFYRLLIVSH